MIIITGATSGLGLALAEDLAKRSATLVLACRDTEKGNEIRAKLIKTSRNENISVEKVDFTSLQSVQDFAEKLLIQGQPIFAIVNNAGLFFHPPQQTKDNLEVTFQTNYLAHFLLTIKLLPLIRKSIKDARIINITARDHLHVDRFPQKEFHTEFDDSQANRFQAYQYSKFCLTLFAGKLSELLSSTTNVSVHCVDPGNVETGIFRHLPPFSNRIFYWLQRPIRPLILKTPNEGIQGVLYALLEDPKPAFYIEGTHASSNYNPLLHNPILTDTLWRISRTLCESNSTSTKD